MSQHSDVAFALTDEMDKLLRETLKALPLGHVSIEILDALFERAQDGWKLYHHSDYTWNEGSDAISNIHLILIQLADSTSDVTYAIIDGPAATECCAQWGTGDDPFNMEYEVRLVFSPAPAPPERQETKSCEATPQANLPTPPKTQPAKRKRDRSRKDKHRKDDRPARRKRAK